MIVKVLRFLLRKKNILPALLILAGSFISSFTATNIYITRQQEIAQAKYDQFYNIEMVPSKPENGLIVFPDHVNMYSKHGEKFGELMNTPLIYSLSSPRTCRDSLLEMQVFGWVWKESLDGKGRLQVPENIRYRSNSHIIARLDQGTMLDTIYTNELNSWTLINFTGFVPKKYLLIHEEYDDIPGIKKFSSHKQVKKTDTRRAGGVSTKPFGRPVIKFEELILPVRLVLSLVYCTFFIWIPGMLYFRLATQDKRKTRMKASIFILSGMIAGIIFHWDVYSTILF